MNDQRNQGLQNQWQYERAEPTPVRAFLTERVKSTLAKIRTLNEALDSARADLADAEKALAALDASKPEGT